jgi:hypothetical protein
VKIAQQYFDDNFKAEASLFNLIGGFYEKTYDQNMLDMTFDSDNDGGCKKQF